jgi:radial spoke head protein 4A
MQDQLHSLNHQAYGPFTLSKHIGETLETIVHEQPADPLGCLEEVSALLWKQRHITPPPHVVAVPDEELSRCNSILALLGKLGSPAAVKLEPVFFEFKEKWGDVGITFENDFTLMLQCSLIKLAELETITGVRLWGMFNTPLGPFYVAEVDIPLEFRAEDAAVVGPYDVPVEVGVGANRFVYYITKSPFDEWERLPDVRPSDISQSREVQWQLTGDLSAAVKSFKVFDVTEDVFIRALIARISAATILAPTDYIQEYQPEEEEQQKEPREEEEEAKEPPPKQLKLVINKEFEPVEDVASIEWVHVRKALLPQGRETYKKAAKPPKPPKQVKEKKPREGEEEEEEDQKEEPEDEPAEEEEEVPEEAPELFGNVGEDEPIREEEPCWLNKTFPSLIPGQSFVTTESVRWPGAFNLSDGRKACSFYYGLGTKLVLSGFQPPLPPKIQGEYRRKMTERADPTLDEEKEVERLKHPPKEEEEEDQQE